MASVRPPSTAPAAIAHTPQREVNDTPAIAPTSIATPIDPDLESRCGSLEATRRL
jgi:hypothetical protein